MKALCQMTGLNRTGFYRWRVPPQARPVEMELRDQMQKVALESPAYGYRRITRRLQQGGFAVNHKRVLRMMREDNLLCVRRRRFVITTDSRHNLTSGHVLGVYLVSIFPGHHGDGTEHKDYRDNI